MKGLRPMRVVKLKKLRHDAPDLSPSATFKSVTNSIQFLCNLFSIMIIFDKFRALDILRHGRGGKGDGGGHVLYCFE